MRLAGVLRALLSAISGMVQRSRPLLSGAAGRHARVVRSLASGKGMDSSGSNCRSCAGSSESGFHLVFRDTHGFRANGKSQQRLDGAVAPVRCCTNVRFIWQTLSYEWDTRLLAFDADVQDVLLTSMGIASRGTVFLVVEILLVAIALLQSISLGCNCGRARAWTG